MKKLILAIAFVLTNFLTFAQKDVYVTISPRVGNELLQLNQNFTSLNGKLFKLEHFNYYLSNLHIIHDGGQDLDFSDTIFLVKDNQFILSLGKLSIQSIESLQFGIGVPPNLNTQAGADAQDISIYPSDHPLSFQDPSMFWGWTSGYMHMIIGGRVDANNDQYPEKLFELHNLGDANYYTQNINVTQTNTSPEKIDIYLDCHVDRWLKNIPIQTVGVQHTAVSFNASVMLNAVHENVFDQPATASINPLEFSKGNLFFHSDINTVVWENVKKGVQIQLTDLSGKSIMNELVKESGFLNMSEFKSGIYIFSITSNDGTVLNSLKISL